MNKMKLKEEQEAEGLFDRGTIDPKKINKKRGKRVKK
jgi:hypothetical protein